MMSSSNNNNQQEKNSDQTLQDQIDFIEAFIKAVKFQHNQPYEERTEYKNMVARLRMIYDQKYYDISIHNKQPIGWFKRRYSFEGRSLSHTEWQTYQVMRRRYVQTPVRDQEQLHARFYATYEYLAGILLDMYPQDFNRAYFPDVRLVVDAIYFLQERRRTV